MSIKKYTDVADIFFELIDRYKIEKGYSGLARYLGVEYQVLMKWKKRDKIADYSQFLVKCPGINLNCLKTLEGDLFPEPNAAEVFKSMAKPIGIVSEPEVEYSEEKGVMTLKGLTPSDMMVIEELLKVPRERMADTIDALRALAKAGRAGT